MNQLRFLSLKGNPVTGIPKYRDQVVLLSRSVHELDDKDVTEHERKYLVSLISRKKVQGTVYNEIKNKKKDAVKMGVEGNTLALHQSRPSDSAGPQMLSFAEFCQLYGKGDDPSTIDADFGEYLKYNEMQKAKLANQQSAAILKVGNPGADI